MSEPRSITILHLSDMQFGPKHRFETTAPGSLFARLRDDFTAMHERHGLVPDLILITGDLVESGKPSEFKQFKAFAEATVEHFGLPRRRLVMIPGNHDINRAAAESYFKDCEGDERTPKLPYWPKLRHYAAMFAEFYTNEPDLQFSETEPYTTFEYPDLGVVVAGLNSTIADSHRADDHYGFLGELQLRHFAPKLRLAADQGLLRIAAIHHHPIHPEGDPAKQDLRDLKRFLGPYLNLVVHGHIHEDELHWLDNTTPILGVGSAGVKAPQRPEEVPNQYQWIRVTAKTLEYGSRAYIPDQKRWVDDLRPDRDGQQWWQHKTVPFERVSSLTSAVTTTSSETDPLARAIASYRASLSRQLRQRPMLVDLATYGEDSDLTHGLELLTIFIPQRASQEIPRSDRHDEFRARRTHDEPEEFIRETTGPIETIDTIVTSEAHPWILLLGTPGAGKTFLTMWLALKLCAAGESLANLSPDLIPVRIELRLFVERWASAHKLGQSHDFFDYLDQLHREESRPLRADALRALAAQGRLLWLFDGLDEVANPTYRAEIATMITGIRETHGGRGIITGRIVGCQQLRPRFHNADIHCFTLLELSDPQIADFLERWHRLAFPNAPDLGARRRERLTRTLADNPTVRDLCRNPLLLTLVALLNRGDELPRRRHKLLERATELMLSQWETNKNLPAGSAIQFDPADKRRYLAELAWHMLTELPEGPGNVIEAEDLERFTTTFCERHFQASPLPAAANARALIQHLRERNYILGLLGGTQFGFLHKAFFEYLAAEEAAHRFRSQQWRLADLQRLFVDHWREDTWTEILILICGLLQEDRSEPVVAALQAVLGSAPMTQPRGLLPALAFAVRGLVEVRRLDTGPALALALALNRHISSVLQLQPLAGWSLDYHSRRTAAGKLRGALSLAAGTWPGAEQALEEAAQNDSRWASQHSTLYTLLSALDRRSRLSWCLRFTNDHKFGPFDLRSIYDEEHTSEANTDLWSLLSAYPELSPPVTIAVAVLLWESSAPQEEIDRFISLSAPQVRRPLSDFFSAQQKDGRTRSNIPYRSLVSIAIHALSPAHTNGGASFRYLRDRFLRMAGRFSDQEIHHIKNALGDDRGDALITEIQCNPWNFDPLQRTLTHHEGPARNLLASLAPALQLEPERLHPTTSWLRRTHGAEGQRLADLAEALYRPGNDAGELERALRLSIHPDGTPDWFAIYSIGDTVIQLNVNKTLRLVDAALSLQTPDSIAIALHLLACTPTHRETDEWHRTFLGRFTDLLKAALTSQPWLALSYFTDLPTEVATDFLAAASTPELRRHLAEHPFDTLRDGQLTAASEQARRIDPLLGQLPLRHLLAHGTDPSLRIRAALELEDWPWLHQAAASPQEDLRTAAQAALDVADTLADVLRAGRLRTAEIRRNGVRVGQLSELSSDATRFTYDNNYLTQPKARPISPTLPLRPEPFDSPGLHPLFEGLLPQGWLLDIDVRKYRLKSGDQFGLLLATGRHTIGAIEVIPEGEP